MSHLLEIPDALYTALKEAAEARGLSLLGWITSHLPSSLQATPSEDSEQAQSPKTLADLFAGRVGRIQSGGKERLSEERGAAFTDHLEEKKKAKKGAATYS